MCGLICIFLLKKCCFVLDFSSSVCIHTFGPAAGLCWFGSSRNANTVKAFTFLPPSLPSILKIFFFFNTVFPLQLPYQQTICRANHESCVITSAPPMTVLTEISFKSLRASINLPALQIQQDLVFENIHSKGGSDNMHSWLSPFSQWQCLFIIMISNDTWNKSAGNLNITAWTMLVSQDI